MDKFLEGNYKMRYMFGNNTKTKYDWTKVIVMLKAGCKIREIASSLNIPGRSVMVWKYANRDLWETEDQKTQRISEAQLLKTRDTIRLMPNGEVIVIKGVKNEDTFYSQS
jgi:hypothetical protein